MKKVFTVLMAMMLVFSLVACGETPEKEDPTTPTTPTDNQQSAWLKTKTGQFYSQIKNDQIYMEYNFTSVGTQTTGIAAVSGEKRYWENKEDGFVIGLRISDGQYVYDIDNDSKQITKSTVASHTSEDLNILIKETDVDPTAVIVGTRLLFGKTYDTEQWDVNGTSMTLGFSGSKLACIITILNENEIVFYVDSYSDQVDDSLFEVPSGYTVTSV